MATKTVKMEKDGSVIEVAQASFDHVWSSRGWKEAHPDADLTPLVEDRDNLEADKVNPDGVGPDEAHVADDGLTFRTKTEAIEYAEANGLDVDQSLLAEDYKDAVAKAARAKSGEGDSTPAGDSA